MYLRLKFVFKVRDSYLGLGFIFRVRDPISKLFGFRAGNISSSYCGSIVPVLSEF